MARHGAAQRRQDALRQSAARDLRGGLAGARALDHVADVVELVEKRSTQVGVARSRDGDGLRVRRPRGGRLDGEHVAPVRRVAIGHEQRDRSASGAPVPHPAQHADPVLLDALPFAAAVAALAAAQLGVDGGDVHGEPGRAAVEDGREAGPVRLPGGEIAQSAHAPTLSAPRAAAQGGRRASDARLPRARTSRRRPTQDGAATGRPVRLPCPCGTTHFTTTCPACRVNVWSPCMIVTVWPFTLIATISIWPHEVSTTSPCFRSL